MIREALTNFFDFLRWRISRFFKFTSSGNGTELLTKRDLVREKEKLLDRLELLNHAIECYDSTKYKEGQAVYHKFYGVCVVQEAYPMLLKEISPRNDKFSFNEIQENKRQATYKIAHRNGVCFVGESTIIPYNDNTRHLYED